MNDYPTKKQLQKIREWGYLDFQGLIDYIDDFFNHDFGLIDFINNKAIIVTGGWSGNEDIINAMSDNIVWWDNYWISSSRGGKYIFRK